MDDLIFIGVNLKKWLQREMDRVKLTVTSGMEKNELKAYELGIENLSNLFDSMVQLDNNEVLVHLKDKNDIMEEFDYDDLVNYVADKYN